MRIEILSGPESGRVAEFQAGTWRVGRSKDNDLVLPVESVSGHHLELTVGADGAVRFRDLGSTNGTFAAGLQAQEGEWPAGSELRLGGCALKHLAAGDAGLLAEAAADDGDARARAAALQGGRRAPLPLLAGGVLVVGGVGFGLWWFLLRGGEGSPAPGPGAAGQAAAAATDPDDLLEGLGNFEEASAWQLPEGAAISGGQLTTGAARSRVALLRSLPLEGGGLRLSAEVAGAPLHAWIGFGTGSDADEGVAWGSWLSGDLADGAAELALPEGATWFQIALLGEGAARVRNLRATALERSASFAATPAGRLALDGGNLLLLAGDSGLLAIAAADGAWSSDDAGVRWEGSGEQTWILGGVFAGPLALAEGGPVGVPPMARVEHSPGLLLGDASRRLLVANEPPARWIGTESGLRRESGGRLRLLWDLEPALTEAARLAREIANAARDADDRRLLAASARLLRDYPLDEDKVAAALHAQREALQRGRRRLAELQTAAAAAILVGARDALEPLASGAADLAQRFPGSALGAEAESLGADLAAALAAELAAADEAERAWRARLQDALARGYPWIAGWIGAQDAEAGR